ncbi:hypothetical protein HLH32_13260 [Gluconacetobacter liquefaciens]|uniref:PAS domain-containing protein n=2 Tax=Gluconacetobacter liquefaciens TaxID=89584 RepID=A0A7W4JM50_GLULI|nr:hypothetical protein [Gluconacetobacter liquefaciens]
MKILVAPNGRTWNQNSRDFFQYFGFFEKNTDFISHSVQNLGFATIETFATYTRICFQPASFAMACLQRVIEILLTRPHARIVLERFGSCPAPLEVLQNRNDAIARLRTLQSATQSDRDAPAAPTIIPLSLDRLGDAKRASLQTALTAWREARHHTTTRNVADIATSPVFGGGGLAWIPGQDRCQIAAWPRTYETYSGQSHDDLVGRDIRDLPDAAYMLPTTRAFFTAASSQEPRLDLIEARMTSADGSQFWCRYERLVLPWRASPSDMFVCSVPLVRLVRRI